MSALAVQHEHPVEFGGNRGLQWLDGRPEEVRTRPALVLLDDGRDGRAPLEELSNGDPPPLILWGEE